MGKKPGASYAGNLGRLSHDQRRTRHVGAVHLPVCAGDGMKAYDINPPPSDRYLDAWIARTRRVLGKPVAPPLGGLPDDVRRFIEGMD